MLVITNITELVEEAERSLRNFSNDDGDGNKNVKMAIGLGYVHTGPIPNGSDLKIVTDRPFVHTGPAHRTVTIRSRSGPITGP